MQVKKSFLKKKSKMSLEVESKDGVHPTSPKQVFLQMKSDEGQTLKYVSSIPNSVIQLMDTVFKADGIKQLAEGLLLPVIQLMDAVFKADGKQLAEVLLGKRWSTSSNNPVARPDTPTEDSRLLIEKINNILAGYFTQLSNEQKDGLGTLGWLDRDFWILTTIKDLGSDGKDLEPDDVTKLKVVHDLCRGSLRPEDFDGKDPVSRPDTPSEKINNILAGYFTQLAEEQKAVLREFGWLRKDFWISTTIKDVRANEVTEVVHDLCRGSLKPKDFDGKDPVSRPDTPSEDPLTEKINDILKGYFTQLADEQKDVLRELGWLDRDFFIFDTIKDLGPDGKVLGPESDVTKVAFVVHDLCRGRLTPDDFGGAESFTTHAINTMLKNNALKVLPGQLGQLTIKQGWLNKGGVIDLPFDTIAAKEVVGLAQQVHWEEAQEQIQIQTCKEGVKNIVEELVKGKFKPRVIRLAAALVRFGPVFPDVMLPNEGTIEDKINGILAVCAKLPAALPNFKKLLKENHNGEALGETLTALGWIVPPIQGHDK